MSTAAVMEWAATEEVQLSVKGGRIAWRAVRMPPADLLKRLSEYRQELLAILTQRYRDAVTKEAGAPFDWLTQHYFTVDDLSDLEAGLYPNPEVLGAQIRLDYRHPFGWPGNAANPTAMQADYSADDPLDLLATQGLELVPDDRRYLLDYLVGRTQEQQIETLRIYAMQWLSAMANKPNHQRQNAGRFAANTWLRRGVNQ